MKIERIQQVYGADLQKVAGGVKPPEKKEGTAKTDSVSFSKKAKDLASSSANSSAEAIAKSSPDVRAELVRKIQEKVAAGFYESPEFLDKLASVMTEKYGVKPDSEPGYDSGYESA